MTGATGQVGSTLLRYLQAAGLKPVAAVRNPLGAALCHAAVPDCDIRIGTLTPASGESHLLDDCDVIVNCAIEGSGGIPRNAYTRNRRLVDGLLQAKSVRWLVHFSTVAVYGELLKPCTDEERQRRRPHPTSEYGRSKLYVERYAARRAGAKAIDCTILRLGHVYGAGIGRSREIVELSRSPHFRLPFDGRLPSNAIHVDQVAAAMLEFLQGEPRTDVYSFAEHQNTWREVFDWHTGCLGQRPVTGMSDAESTAHRDAQAHPSVARDAIRWARGLPIRSLVRSPALFDMALQILVRTPASVTQRVADINRRTGARGQIARAAHRRQDPIPPLYFSAAMPGPFLNLPGAAAHGFGSDDERCRELREWCEGWSKPRIPFVPHAIETGSTSWA